MIIRQFLLSTRNASPGERAEAASALARAFLHGDLASDASNEAKTALLALLDDPSSLVRRSLAEACASSPLAPRTLILALAADLPEIACLVLGRSPVLTDEDLVDSAAIGCETTRSAIAGRADLTRSVAAALGEVAGRESLLVLASNAYAQIGLSAHLRMIERHGDDDILLAALNARGDLPIEVRQTLAVRIAESLAAKARDSGAVSSERSDQMVRDARENATLTLSEEIDGVGLARLVVHLRKRHQLNAGLILRAILTQRMAFAEMALADLSGLSRARVAGLMLEPRSFAFGALHRKAGMSPAILPVTQAALTAWREAARGESDLHGPRLSRRMIECALTACEAMPTSDSRGLIALLARFEAEAAREEAREIAQAMADEAERDEILRLERQELAMIEALPIELVATDEAAAAVAPFEAILDILPAAILTSYREELRKRQEDAAANASTEPSRVPVPKPESDRLPARAVIDADAIVSAPAIAQIRTGEAFDVTASMSLEPIAVVDAVFETFSVPNEASIVIDPSERNFGARLEIMTDTIPLAIAGGVPAPALEEPEIVADVVTVLPIAARAEQPAAKLAVVADPLVAVGRPREVALAVAASMIPAEIILSYRADRNRIRLAA